MLEPLVLSRFEAALALRLGLSVGWCVSVTEPAGELPEPVLRVPRRLHLAFSDAEEGEHAPGPAHMARLMAFAREVDGPGIVHCDVGVSRCAGVTLGMLAARVPPEQARAALNEAVHRSESLGWRIPGRRVRPNARLVALADEALGLGGRLGAD